MAPASPQMRAAVSVPRDPGRTTRPHEPGGQSVARKDSLPYAPGDMIRAQ